MEHSIQSYLERQSTPTLLGILEHLKLSQESQYNTDIQTQILNIIAERNKTHTANKTVSPKAEL